MDQETRRLYLREMQIDSWVLREAAEIPEAEPIETPVEPPVKQAPVAAEPAPAQPEVQSPEKPGPNSRQASKSPVEQGAGGISSENIESAEPEAATSVVSTMQPATADIAEMGWTALHRAVADCNRCRLHETRKQPVVGIGNRKASLMVIGEAPGAEEDAQGEPFVGRAGLLLNEMLAAIGLQREEIYIANILKSRPPNNRNPQAEEVIACMPFLQQQISLIKPEVILCVGKIAAMNLLNLEASLGKLRTSQHQLPGSDTPVVVTYHPAYLLRSPAEKGKTWADLQRVQQLLLSADQGSD